MSDNDMEISVRKAMNSKQTTKQTKEKSVSVMLG